MAFDVDDRLLDWLANWDNKDSKIQDDYARVQVSSVRKIRSRPQLILAYKSVILCD